MATIVTTVLVVSIVLMILFVLYYWFFVYSTKSTSRSSRILKNDVLPPNTKHRPEVVVNDKGSASSPQTLPGLKPMYAPKEVGHRSGQERVFITNKGLRVYETNEQGWPMPNIK